MQLPEFAEPPVIETVLGVEFAPLVRWGVPHFGLYWREIDQEFSRFEVQPPLGSQLERFGKNDLISAEAPLELVAAPPLRCWFIHSDDRTLIQVQDNRFNFNWRKLGSERPYPRYEQSIRAKFEREWSRFKGFVESQKLGDPQVLQCEVTYVNHLEIGSGWEKTADLNQVFPAWSGQLSGKFLPSPERLRLSVSYLLPNEAGRLRISAQPAIRNADGVEVVQLTLTARGRPESSSTVDIMRWLDQGREWVVRGFADFTSPKMHAIWKRVQ